MHWCGSGLSVGVDVEDEVVDPRVTEIVCLDYECAGEKFESGPRYGLPRHLIEESIYGLLTALRWCEERLGDRLFVR